MKNKCTKCGKELEENSKYIICKTCYKKNFHYSVWLSAFFGLIAAGFIGVAIGIFFGYGFHKLFVNFIYAKENEEETNLP